MIYCQQFVGILERFCHLSGILGENDMASQELRPLLTAREAAEFLHVSMFTLSKIEREGNLVPFRTPGGHRRYSMEMLRRYLESSRNHPLNDRQRPEGSGDEENQPCEGRQGAEGGKVMA